MKPLGTYIGNLLQAFHEGFLTSREIDDTIRSDAAALSAWDETRTDLSAIFDEAAARRDQPRTGLAVSAHFDEADPEFDPRSARFQRAASLETGPDIPRRIPPNPKLYRQTTGFVHHGHVLTRAATALDNPAPAAHHDPSPAAHHDPSPAAHHDPAPAAYHDPAPAAYHAASPSSSCAPSRSFPSPSSSPRSAPRAAASRSSSPRSAPRAAASPSSSPAGSPRSVPRAVATDDGSCLEKVRAEIHRIRARCGPGMFKRVAIAEDGHFGHCTVDIGNFAGRLRRDLEVYAALMQSPEHGCLRVRVVFPSVFPAEPPELWLVRPQLLTDGDPLPVSGDGRIYLRGCGKPGADPGSWSSVTALLEDFHSKVTAKDVSVDFGCLHFERPCKFEGWDRYLKKMPTRFRSGQPQRSVTVRACGTSFTTYGDAWCDRFELGDRIGLPPDLYEKIKFGRDTVLLEVATVTGRRRICAIDDRSPHAGLQRAVLLPKWIKRDLFIRDGDQIGVRQIVLPQSGPITMTVRPTSTRFYQAMEEELGSADAPLQDQIRCLTNALQGRSGLGTAAATQHTRLGVVLGGRHVFLDVVGVGASAAAPLSSHGGTELRLALRDAPNKQLTEKPLDDVWSGVVRRRRDLLPDALAAAGEAEERQRQSEAENYQRVMALLSERYPQVGDEGPVVIRFAVDGQPDMTARFEADATTEHALAFVCLRCRGVTSRKLLPGKVTLRTAPPAPFTLSAGDSLRGKGLNRARVFVDVEGDAKGGAAASTPPSSPARARGLELGGPQSPCPDSSWAWLAERGDGHPKVFNGKYFEAGRPRTVTAREAQDIAEVYQRIRQEKQRAESVYTVHVAESAVGGFVAGIPRYGILYGRVDARAMTVTVDAVYEPLQGSDGSDFVPQEDDSIAQVDGMARLLGMTRVGIIAEMGDRSSLNGNLMSAKEALMLCRETVLHGPHCVLLLAGAGESSECNAYQVSHQAVQLFCEGTLCPCEVNRAVIRSARTIEVVQPGAKQGTEGREIETAWLTVNAGIKKLAEYGCEAAPGAPAPPAVRSRFQRSNRQWFQQFVEPQFSTICRWLRSDRASDLSFVQCISDFHLLVTLSRSLDAAYDLPRVCRAVTSADGSLIGDIEALVMTHAGLMEPGQDASMYGVTSQAAMVLPPQQDLPELDGDGSAMLTEEHWRATEPVAPAAGPTYTDSHHTDDIFDGQYHHPDIPGGPYHTGHHFHHAGYTPRPAPRSPSPTDDHLTGTQLTMLTQLMELTGDSDPVAARRVLKSCGWNLERAAARVLERHSQPAQPPRSPGAGAVLDRKVRMVMEATGCDESVARNALDMCQGDVDHAVAIMF